MENLRNLLEIYRLAAEKFDQYKGEDFVLPQVFKDQVREINSNSISYNRFSAIIETRGTQNGVLNIYLPNQWFYIASYFTDFYNELLKYKKAALSVFTKERLKELNGGLLSDDEIASINELDLDSTSKDYLIKFITDYSWWGGAKTIDRGDFYVSPILNCAKLVNASQSFVADLCAFLADKEDLVQSIIYGGVDEKATEKHSLIINEKKLTTFILSTVKFFDSIDKLDAIIPYASSTSPIKVSKDGLFSLTGMFLESSIAEARKRNTVKIKRWFEDQFTLGERNVFLSTQWNANGDYQLTLDDFIKMIQCCYGTEYIYKTGPNGEHQLFLVSKKANNDLKGYPLQQIFYGAPGTGKSHRIKEIIKEHNIDEKEQVIRTTFHPDSDYSTFVGCYKPIMKSVPQTYVVEGNEKPVMADKDNQATKEEIVYDYTPQAFVQAYTKAWTTDKPVILVIEEINRGNCAQIFGDIFQLLDRGNDNVSEYEIKPDMALENYLKEYFAAFDDLDEQIKTGKIMKLPANLYIWATMNTSDQSLFPIDSAFKRRWEWKYIKIAWPYKKNEDGSFKTDENREKIHFNYSIEGGHDWWAFLQQINAIIDKMTNSADKQLGYFFAKTKDDVISYETFVSKVCFYLWNDIFKTYALDEQQGDLFKFAKKIKDKDENEKEVIGHLTFPEFYDGDGNVVPDVARQFIEHVMTWNTEGKKENS